MSITQDILERTIRFEGNVPWMYLDQPGNVTVGVGHLLASAEAAVALPFVDGGSVASDDQKRDAWNTVHGAEHPHPFGFYESLTTIRLSGSDARNLLQTDLTGFESGLRTAVLPSTDPNNPGETAFPDYDSYPASAQAGLIDMAFNLGLPRLLKLFPKFCHAVRIQDWNTAANECHRNGIQESRNTEVKNLFLDAAGSGPTS